MTPRMTTQTLAVLAKMLAHPQTAMHGYGLIQATGIPGGTLYPILERLTKAGWLEERFEDIDPASEGRPRRRLYRLTSVGKRNARAELEKHRAWLTEAFG